MPALYVAPFGSAKDPISPSHVFQTDGRVCGLTVAIKIVAIKDKKQLPSMITKEPSKPGQEPKVKVTVVDPRTFSSKCTLLSRWVGWSDVAGKVDLPSIARAGVKQGPW